MCIRSSQLRKLLTCMVCIHPLVLHEQTGCIATTKFVWTAVILNGSEASGTLTNSRAFKMWTPIAGRCMNFFEAKRGVRMKMTHICVKEPGLNILETTSREPPALKFLYMYYIAQAILNTSVMHTPGYNSISAVRNPLRVN